MAQVCYWYSIGAELIWWSYAIGMVLVLAQHWYDNRMVWYWGGIVLVFVWHWCGIGMAQVCFWDCFRLGIGTVLVWYQHGLVLQYYDISMISVTAFVGIVWNWQGFVMVAAWYWYEIGMVLVWYWYAIGMVLVRYWYAIGMVLVRYWYGIVLAWYWYGIGIGMVLVW